jgi:histone acetyltransferase
MENRVEANFYNSLEEFIADFNRMIDNCKKFNDPKSVYVKCATKLDSFFKVRLKAADSLSNGGKTSKKGGKV